MSCAVGQLADHSILGQQTWVSVWSFSFLAYKTYKIILVYPCEKGILLGLNMVMEGTVGGPRQNLPSNAGREWV